MKKLLVIGAGINQVPIILTAKKMGCYIIAVSPKGEYPGIDLADEWIEEDIFSAENIIATVKEKGIDGVISDQSDMAAPIVAYIADKLGLPNYGYENALIFTIKSKMRELYEKLDFNVPVYFSVNNEKDAFLKAESIGYPVVVKPTDSFASRGITLVRNEDELLQSYKNAMSASKNKEVVIEQYISGPQYFSQGFVSNGKLRMFAYSDRYYYDLENIFIPYTNAFPALIEEELKVEMNKIMETIVQYLKVPFGQVWAEWILDEKTNELYIVEMAIRGAGANVTSDIIPRAYGVDTQEYYVKAALGEDTSEFLNMELPKEKAAAFFSFLLPEGIVEDVNGLEELRDIEGVVKADLKNIKIGDIIPAIQDKGSRYGLIVVQGKNREELDLIHQRLIDTLKVTVKTKEGEKGAIWK